MPIQQYEKGKTSFKLDAEGYPLLYEKKVCVKCNAPVKPGAFKDKDKQRRFNVLGYCLKCHKEIMGW